DGVLRAPLEVGELAGRDEVDLGLPRRVEAVLPALEGREDRKVLRRQGVSARAEDVREPTLVDEDGDLALADDELRLVLDLVALAREAPDDRVPRAVEELDDVDELPAQLVHEAHVLSVSPWGGDWVAVRPGRSRH